MKFVVKGAYYFSEGYNRVLVPHYTGEFGLVDCTQYRTKKDILSDYDKEYFKKVKEDYVEVDDVKYYYTEYDCFNPDDFDLLSDLSELFHYEDSFNF